MQDPTFIPEERRTLRERRIEDTFPHLLSARLLLEAGSHVVRASWTLQRTVQHPRRPVLLVATLRVMLLQFSLRPGVILALPRRWYYTSGVLLCRSHARSISR